MPSQTDMTPPTDDSLATVREACEEIIASTDWVCTKCFSAGTSKTFDNHAARCNYSTIDPFRKHKPIARLALAMLERVPNTQFTLAKELATCAREIRGEE